MQNILAFVELDENKEISRNKSITYELMIEEEYTKSSKKPKDHDDLKELKEKKHNPLRDKCDGDPEKIEYDYDPLE